MQGLTTGVDNLDVTSLRTVANLIAVPVLNIINLSIEKCICPQAWKIAKVFPHSKNLAAPFSGTNSSPVSLLPALGKLMERVTKQIQTHFDVNNLNADYQHAYRPGHCTCTAPTQMTDDWLSERDNRKLLGAVLLDFSSAFDVIDHSLLLDRLKLYGFTFTALKWMESFLTNRRQTVFFNPPVVFPSTMQLGQF